MDRSTELGLIDEIIGLADQKRAYLDADVAHSPISRYSSPERFERENRMIFRRRPVVVAHSTELDGANAFLARRFMDLPLLLVRGSDGDVRAFLNVCRHRGATLERGAAGCKRVFTCPYHGWSWSNDGSLRAVPQEAQGFPDLPRAERGLRTLPCREAHGFIWIMADPEAASMDEIDTWLSGIGTDFDWLDMAGHRVAVTEEVEIAANWKLLVEGGIEAYHFRVAHAATIAPYFPDNLSTYRQFGPHIRSVLPRSSMADLAGTPREDWQIRRDANLLYVLMPNVQLLVQQDHVVWINAEPVREDLTRLRLTTLVPKEADGSDAHWQKNHQITHVTLMEDFVLGEEVQSGFASRGNPSHLFGRFEGALNRFNLMVEEMLAG